MRPPAVTRRRLAGHRGSSASTSEDEHHNPWPIRAAIIGAIATLLASVGGLYFSAQASRQATEQASQAQVAQTSERFSRSVEQLGSDSIAVRIGAVYSFARLMRDSEDDQKSIVEILNTFVRVQAAQAPRPDASVEGPPVGRRAAPVDLLAALRVLNAFEETTHPDSGAILLLQVDFAEFDLHRVVLTSAELTYADLTDANLTDADLTDANLTDATLTGALLSGTDLSGATLTGADLSGTILTFADLTGADLSGTNLTGTLLAGADLSGADLSGADLSSADLSSADLTDITCTSTTKWPPFASVPECK